MLVDPVRHQATDDVFLPPRLASDVLDPRLGDVPVVDHVVIVEDHRRSHHRQQPTLDSGRPRLAVQHRVLLEVGHEFGRWLVGFVVAVGVDVQLGQRRRVVGVDLIAEHHQEVGPLVDRLAEHSQPVGTQRVDPDAPFVVRRLEIERGFVRGRGPAAPEQDSDRLVPTQRADHAGGIGARGFGPTLHPVKCDVVGDAALRVQPAEYHERIVVTPHGER